ncbi:hypothetical protein pkur_cds_581 [Pandoravirus kuranda]|uniref:Uncharacterized protein n=1 Tax=Pandoravirus kuranda TaxID=3019033 RepID=A0AA95EEZ8_9VIRU|nr:hypothetical protein pkur_cds_581 [Pandoravirus kuranda]
MSLAPDASEATTCLCRMASRFGRIDVLAWCRANELPWDGWALCEAAMLGQNGCAPARWAYAMCCPIHHSVCLRQVRMVSADETFVAWIKSQPDL